MTFVPSVGKWVVDLQIHNHPKIQVWVTSKQSNNLTTTFGESKYSRRGNIVYAVFKILDNGKKYFVWASTNETGKKYLTYHFRAVDVTDKDDVGELGDIENEVADDDYVVDRVVKEARVDSDEEPPF
jgi:hypothetical protein